mmetsp:Transcript_38005/g.88866  ORF Transcript_38005/g.88866 Transcript_38005/m.88866 type:complete len:361 (+) Transcript_38005:104-1186(+)
MCSRHELCRRWVACSSDEGPLSRVLHGSDSPVPRRHSHRVHRRVEVAIKHSCRHAFHGPDDRWNLALALEDPRLVGATTTGDEACGGLVFAELHAIDEARLAIVGWERNVVERVARPQVPHLDGVVGPPGTRQNMVAMDVDRVSCNVRAKDDAHGDVLSIIPDQHHVVPASAKKEVRLLSGPLDRKDTVGVPSGVALAGARAERLHALLRLFIIDANNCIVSTRGESCTVDGIVDSEHLVIFLGDHIECLAGCDVPVRDRATRTARDEDVAGRAARPSRTEPQAGCGQGLALIRVQVVSDLAGQRIVNLDGAIATASGEERAVRRKTTLVYLGTFRDILGCFSAIFLAPTHHCFWHKNLG